MVLASLGLEEIFRVVHRFQRSAGENSFHPLPQVDHVGGCHGQGCDQIRLRFQACWGHCSNWVKLDHLHLLLSVFALGFNNNPALQVDEACEILFEKNLFGGRIDINCRDMFVADLAQPRLELHGISNGCAQRKEWTSSSPDDPLQSITLGSVESVDLVEDKVFKLTVTSIKNHELSLTLLHLLSRGTTSL